MTKHKISFSNRSIILRGKNQTRLFKHQWRHQLQTEAWRRKSHWRTWWHHERAWWRHRQLDRRPEAVWERTELEDDERFRDCDEKRFRRCDVDADVTDGVAG